MEERKINNFLVGSDPEWFIINRSEEKFISAEGIVGGTKDRPKPIGDGFFVQEDCVATEGNIPPCATREEFVNNVSSLRHKIESLVPKGCELYCGSTGFFAPEELMTDQAMTFGCEPDFNAYTGHKNACPSPTMEQQERFSGGHIHIGYSEPTKETNRNIIKAADLFLGLPSILMDDDKIRRSMYGKAGAYRNKNFGVEYRVLSSFWTKSEETIGWAYDQLSKAISFVNNESKALGLYENRVVHAINSYNEKEAELLIKELKIA